MKETTTIKSPSTSLILMHDTVSKVNNIKSLAELVKGGKMHPNEVEFALDNIIKGTIALDEAFKAHLLNDSDLLDMTTETTRIVRTVRSIMLNGVTEELINNIITSADELNAKLDKFYEQTTEQP